MECIVPSILFHKILSIYSLSVAKKSKIKNARIVLSILPYLKYSPCIILWRLNVKGVFKGLPGCDFWKRMLRKISFAKSNNS